jgi:pyruvate,water dikinase
VSKIKTKPLKLNCNKGLNLGTGLPHLDHLLRGLRAGDNLVWQVQNMADYAFFAIPFLYQALAEDRRPVYLRFGDHPPVIPATPGIEIIEIDPKSGFDSFTTGLHAIIEARGGQASYVFDNLSSLVTCWATDELLANFFQVTCPYIFQLGALAYFALSYGQHQHQAIARIKSTTQILINVYRMKKNIYIHPQKVWERYSSEMFVPHLIGGPEWLPIFQSGEAAAISSMAFPQPLIPEAAHSPWDSIYAKLVEFQHSAKREGILPSEIISLKNEYTRILMGNHPEFIKLAEKFFTVPDLIQIRNRLIGSGRIGGKAAGMLLARRILLSCEDFDFAPILEPHDSFYVGSDVFYTFLVNNNLFQERLRITRSKALSLEEFGDIEQRFLCGDFPPDILEQMRSMLDYFGQAPIIVRSSSLMEDSLGNAFAGKYLSVFLPNQGNPEERLAEFLQAIKRVFASTLNPDAVAYRQRQGLTENDEQMAVVVQRVSGTPYKHYFFPPLAGVAFSRNAYPWTSRIDPGKGLIRLVFGLGTRAVNRISGDYCRLIAISQPGLRPEIGKNIVRYSQHNADVLDIEGNDFTTVGIRELLGTHYDYPGIELLASAVDDGVPYDMAGRLETKEIALTFDNLISRTQFIPVMDRLLTVLDKAYGHALDTEFTAHISEKGKVRINLLQCRSLRLPEVSKGVKMPTGLSDQRVLFTSQQFMNTGMHEGIRYVLYISPEAYAAASDDDRFKLGRIIGRLNELPDIIKGSIILIGPGRWGSNNNLLGVNVGYGDISHASVLVEVACENTGHVPELSFGTHFFLDLVESGIFYMAVFPGQPFARFNGRFFCSTSNQLSNLMPDATGYSGLIHLIDVPQATGGHYAAIATDSTRRRAICYIV